MELTFSWGYDKEMQVRKSISEHFYSVLKSENCYWIKETEKVSKGSTEDGKVVCSLKQDGLKRGEKDIPEFTDITVPHHLQPERTCRIHKLFIPSKEGDGHQYAVRKLLSKEGEEGGCPWFGGMLRHTSCSNVGILPRRKAF